MVKITNGVNIFEVTRGAFDGIYSRQGYTILNEKVKDNSEDIVETTEDEKFLNEIIEKPISQWNKEETKRFAALKGIDITGTKNANEAKGIIKDYLESDFQE